MTQPTPQRVITISIAGIGEKAEVYYTYLSPVTGLSYINSPICDLVADQAINSLFVLDYFSTKNGWTIMAISPRKDSPSMEFVRGALQLSILTINPYSNVGMVYQFYVHYLNTVSGVEIKRDPQEGNVEPPH
ncbi:MAG: hypothetical protein M3Y65_18850 [Pseudomonadota bacterium]|nr:hypothetical protein [Pseudomonadota bacterium]